MEPDMNERINCVKLTYYEDGGSLKIFTPKLIVRIGGAKRLRCPEENTGPISERRNWITSEGI
ncbi:hypothetical protein [Methanothermobacter sp. DP]|uniref:hypothetical protein n=1 Tax=unclassified Methanothermobacter TaxID=2631116 RepID=UPI002AA4F66C|nr:hypothetical protein [Methanothermobacter sp. DP]